MIVWNLWDLLLEKRVPPNLPPYFHSICVPQCIFLHLCHMFSSQHILVPSSDFSIHVLNCGSDIGFQFDYSQKNQHTFLSSGEKSETEISWLPISGRLFFPPVTPVTWVSVVCNHPCGWLLGCRPSKAAIIPQYLDVSGAPHVLNYSLLLLQLRNLVYLIPPSFCLNLSF